MNRSFAHKALFPALATGLGLAIALTSCGGGSGGASATSATLAPPQSGEVEVDSTDNYFVPEDVTVTEGSEVVWVNEGRNQHNIVPVDDTPFGVEAEDFQPGEDYRWKASVPGTYRYYCSIHGTATAGMIGAIQVVEP